MDTRGILSFDNEAHFESYMEYLYNSAINLNQWEQSFNFTSARTAFLNSVVNQNTATLPIDEEKLLSVLNSNYLVKIEPWIFKLDLIQRKVFVVASSANGETISSLLQNQPNNSLIRTFSFDDDVFESLESISSLNSVSSSERGSCARTNSISTGSSTQRFEGLNTRFDEILDIKFKYDGWGIYKNLYAKYELTIAELRNEGTLDKPSWHVYKGSCPDINATVAWSWEYQKKKSNTLETGHEIGSITNGRVTGVNLVTDDCHKWTIYRGTRCLTKYKVSEAVILWESFLFPPPNFLPLTVQLGTLKNF